MAVVLLAIVSCNSDVPVTSMDINPSAIALQLNSTATLTVDFQPADATRQSVGWSSNNPSIASVNNNGVVTAHSVGTAIITATTNDGRHTATSLVSVTTLPRRGDVFVGGVKFDGENTQVVLWKNGVAQIFSNRASFDDGISSVFVSGDNVYMSGVYRGVATLWRNGIPQTLSTQWHSRANSVFVANNNVYVVGYRFDLVNGNAQNIATLWRNGVQQNLPSGQEGSFALSVFVSGGNVFVAGYEFRGDQTIATLWRNGVRQNLANNAWATSVHVVGGNVYVAGTVRNTQNVGRTAVVWRNGTRQNLSTIWAESNSVFVSGGNVFVAGSEVGQFIFGDPLAGVDHAMIWRNGVRQALTPTAGMRTFASDVFVVGNDVFVVGAERRVARLWRNGVQQNLQINTPNSIAMSVFVVE